MRHNTQRPDYRRAADAPHLPTGKVRFILFCLSRFRGLMLLMLLLETGQAAGNILVPYAIKALMDGVAHPVSGGSVLDICKNRYCCWPD